MTETVLTQIKEAKAEIATLKANLFETIQKNFHGLIKPIFEKYPVIETISWSQYTPYFNDGEECVFSTNIDYFDINDMDSYDWGRNNKDAKEMFDTIKEFLNMFDDDDYKEMYGDHVKVTITKNGITTSEYDHE